MTIRTVTVPVRLVRFGDVWLGSSVTGLVQSWRPENMDVTLYDPAALQSRTVTINKNQLFAVQRDDQLGPNIQS